jgi:gamma-glutamyl hercynylcysteine S-oxide synthase
MNKTAEDIASKLSATRAQTLSLFDLAHEADLHVSPGFGFRPIIWHLAHIGVFEGYWLLQKMQGKPSHNPYYDRIFDPISTPRVASVNLPSRKEMESYLEGVRNQVLVYLDDVEFDEQDPMLRDAYIFNLVLQHEAQHQETLAYLFQLLPPEKKIRPHIDAGPTLSRGDYRSIEIPGGPVRIGAEDGRFAYDNEYPSHSVEVAAFRIDRTPVTNSDYLQFILDSGYERREFWSDEGWQWKQKEDWSHPLYWIRDRSDWLSASMFEIEPLQPSLPVTGISWYEADAYTRYRGMRLPTEAEWEKAASWDESKAEKRRYAWGNDDPDSERCNFDFNRWAPSPVGALLKGASAYGCLDMTGNVWEWTADPLQGYPGFQAFPYPEYSQEWFDGDHRVLKGGSWATREPVLRTTFRNFFRRHFRIAFAGFRCAADA